MNERRAPGNAVPRVRLAMPLSIIGGLISSTVLTLVVVPVMYSILDDAVSKARRKKSAPAPDQA